MSLFTVPLPGPTQFSEDPNNSIEADSLIVSQAFDNFDAEEYGVECTFPDHPTARFIAVLWKGGDYLSITPTRDAVAARLIEYIENGFQRPEAEPIEPSAEEEEPSLEGE